MRRELPWVAIALVALLALSYLFNTLRNGHASAWILWEKTMTTKDGSGSTEWEPLDGFERLTDCQTSGQQILQSAVGFMKSGGGKLLGNVRPDGRSAMFEVADSGGQRTVDIRYLCFPGQFDPRPGRP